MERLTFNLRPVATGRATYGAAEPAQAPPVVVSEPERDVFAFRALLAFMVVLLVRPQDQLPFLNVFHLANVTGVVACLALVAGRLRRSLPPTRLTPEVVGVLALTAIMIGTIPLSLWPGGSMALFKDQFVKVVLVFLVIANTLTSRARIERFIAVIVLGASYVAARSVLDYLRGVNLVEGGRAAGAVGGLFANPNDMALNMVAFLPLAIAVALSRGRPSLRLLGIAGAGVMALAIIFSKSRGGTVGLIVMMAVLLYQMRRVRPGIAALLVVGSLAALPLLPSSFTERMASIFDADQDPTGSRESRKTLLREGWAAFLANPIVGLGAGQFQNYNTAGRDEPWRQTHNSPLQVAAELGVFGLATFLYLVWTALMAGVIARRAARLTRNVRRARAPAGRAAADHNIEWMQLHGGIIIAACVGWFVAANFASVAYYWTFYLLLGLAGAVRDVSGQVARAYAERPVRADATWGKVA
jgi:O-antigen ligase